MQTAPVASTRLKRRRVLFAAVYAFCVLFWKIWLKGSFVSVKARPETLAKATARGSTRLRQGYARDSPRLRQRLAKATAEPRHGYGKATPDRTVAPSTGKPFPKNGATATLVTWTPNMVLIISASFRKQRPYALLAAVPASHLPETTYEPLPRSRMHCRRTALHRAYHTAQPLSDPVRPHAGASRIARFCRGNTPSPCRCHA